MVTLAALFFILPFFIFSAIAGHIADKFDKSQIAKIVKFCEIIFMFLAAIGFYLQSLNLLLATLFLMGAHSAFFGPVKYGILPQHLHKNQLIAANSLISSSTFIAILLGTIFGGLLIVKNDGAWQISQIALIIALCGFVASLFIPKTQTHPLHLKLNIFSQTYAEIRKAKQNKKICFAIILISLFWFTGATFLAQFPNFVKFTLHGNNEIVTLFLTIFSVGIAVGSLICNLLTKGKIKTDFTALAAFCICIFCADLFLASKMQNFQLASTGEFIGLTAFLENSHNIRILIDLSLIAIAGGIYIVPLYALIQEQSAENFHARMIAVLNIFNSLFMVLSAVFTIVFLKIGLSVPDLFLGLAAVNIFAVILGRKIKKI